MQKMKLVNALREGTTTFTTNNNSDYYGEKKRRWGENLLKFLDFVWVENNSTRSLRAREKESGSQAPGKIIRF